MSSRHYHVGHFHLTPTQVGIPNDRPRYFCIAVQDGHYLPNRLEGKLLRHEQKNNNSGVDGSDDASTSPSSTLSNDPAIQTTLQPNPSSSTTTTTTESPPSSPPATIASFLDKTTPHLPVPNKLLDSNAAWCFDIVIPSDRRSACFTSSYGKYVRGTGSVLYCANAGADKLQLIDPSERQFDAHWMDGLDLVDNDNKNNLRYFSGTEVARLMGFPNSFRFPKDVTEKQRWKLMGNSLNVKVASALIQAGLKASTLVSDNEDHGQVGGNSMSEG